jgi:tetrahydromethanopterin S-methyltransferase subunit C
VTTSHERREPPASRPALWFALLGGPVAWSAHLLASYPLVSVACQLGTATPLHAITLLTAAVAAAAGVTGALALRRVSAAGPGGLGDAFARARFMGLAGTIAGAFFTFVILVEGLPPLLHDPCLRIP